MNTNEGTNNQGKITFRCKQCGKRLSSLKSKIGTELICPYCGVANLIDPSQKAPRPTFATDTTPENSPSADSPQNPSIKKNEAVERPAVQHSWKKKENSLITYSLFGFSLVFCLISALIFNKTLNINNNASTSSDNLEELFLDKESAQAIYTPSDISGETIGLTDDIDPDTEKKLQEAAKRTSSTPKESDIQEIHTLFKKFSSEKDLNKRLEFVFSAKEMKPLMEKWEATSPHTTVIADIILSASQAPSFMLVRFSTGQSSFKDVIFVQEKESGKWKIEWPSLVGYSPYNPKELLTIRPDKPTEVRATLSMGDKYEPPFMDTPDSGNYQGKSYMNINITFPNGEEFSGYVDRHDDTALNLAKKLMLGPTQMVVKIHFPTDTDTKNKNIVIIDEIIRDNWLSDKANEIFKQTTP